MTSRPPQRDLFVSERPVRSEMARAERTRERSYAIRRMITLTVLALAIGGGIYAVIGQRSTNPADIPVIKAEGAYKQKPADPGGIDIPHQDVRVYDQLETKNGAVVQIVHLLPQAEIPKEVPRVAAVVTPEPMPVAPQPAPPAVPKPDSNATILSDPHPAKLLATTVAPAPQAVISAPKSTVAPKQEAATIDQVIANTKSSAVATPAGNNAGAAGSTVIQLASVPDQAKAQEMTQNLQTKYAAQLGDAVLRVARADLGKRGVFYRIQSQALSESDADHICSTLKQNNARCILVRK